MKINTIKFKDAHRMNKNELKTTIGGVDVYEYCCILYCLYKNGNNMGEGGAYGLEICWKSGFLPGDSNNCHYGAGCDYIGYG